MRKPTSIAVAAVALGAAAIVSAQQPFAPSVSERVPGDASASSGPLTAPLPGRFSGAAGSRSRPEPFGNAAYGAVVSDPAIPVEGPVAPAPFGSQFAAPAPTTGTYGAAPMPAPAGPIEFVGDQPPVSEFPAAPYAGGTIGGGPAVSAAPLGDELYPYDAHYPWLHGYFQEIPAYGGYHFFRPYNYKHVLSQAQTSGGWGMSPQMPYSQQFWHRYHQRATMQDHAAAVDTIRESMNPGDGETDHGERSEPESPTSPFVPAPLPR